MSKICNVHDSTSLVLDCKSSTLGWISLSLYKVVVDFYNPLLHVFHYYYERGFLKHIKIQQYWKNLATSMSACMLLRACAYSLDFECYYNPWIWSICGATWASVFYWLNKYFQQWVWWEQHQMMTVSTDPHTARNINVIETVQQLAARFTTGIYHSTSSVSDILNALKWDSLRTARAKTIMLYRIYLGILFLAFLSVTRSVAFYYFWTIEIETSYLTFIFY